MTDDPRNKQDQRSEPQPGHEQQSGRQKENDPQKPPRRARMSSGMTSRSRIRAESDGPRSLTIALCGPGVQNAGTFFCVAVVS